jgi:hypothetical protein
MTTEFKKQFEQLILDGTKIHSLREDRDGRYTVGATMYLTTGAGTEAYRCLKKVLCTGTQKVLILYGNGGYCDAFVYQDVRVIVDDRELSHREVKQLAINDGFDSIDSFFRWFYKDFKGKIVHWTMLRY